MDKLYFSSPIQSVSLISGFLKDENLVTLTQYYNLENVNISIEDFFSGKYYRGEVDGEKPPGFFKYIKPFSPGFKFSHIEELENNITRIHLLLEVNQGGGMVLRSTHYFDLLKSEKGFQILP